MATMTLDAPAAPDVDSATLLDLHRYAVLLSGLRETCETLTAAGAGDVDTHETLAEQYALLRGCVMGALPERDARHVREWAPDLTGRPASPATIYAAATTLAACLTVALDGAAWLASYRTRQIHIDAATRAALEQSPAPAVLGEARAASPGQYL